jgi:hypothetical protein
MSRRITEDIYDRPKKTITDLVQNKKDILEQLADFEEIPPEELDNMSINIELKYITYDKKNKKELFRFGGTLRKIDQKYIVLVGKRNLSFTAQRYTYNDKNEVIHVTRFFKRYTADDKLKNELINTIEMSSEIIEKQKSIIDKQKKELMILKKKCGNKI